MKHLNDAELSSLLSKLTDNSRDSLLIKLVIYTGARSVEALRVTPEDVRDGCVYIKGAKGSANRLVPLPIDYYQTLVAYIRDGEMLQNDRVFPITTRRFRAIWSKYTPNETKGLHSLRHTMGIRHYTKCTDIHATKTLLGHKNIQNTMVYLEYVEGEKKLRETMKGLF